MNFGMSTKVLHAAFKLRPSNGAMSQEDNPLPPYNLQRNLFYFPFFFFFFFFFKFFIFMTGASLGEGFAVSSS
jgi:hypothetical protein